MNARIDSFVTGIAVCAVSVSVHGAAGGLLYAVPAGYQKRPFGGR